MALIGIAITVMVAVGFFLVGGWQSFGGPYPDRGDESLQRSEQAYERTEKANQDLVEAWVNYQLFSWKWWLNVGMATIPWAVWWLLRRKKSTHRLLYVGFVLIILASYMDFLGVTYGFWRYHIEVIPSIPSYIPWDFSMYPVAGMLFLQYEPRLSKHLKALLFACVSALAIEPVFIWLRFYEPIHWSVFYSLPIHYVIYLVAHWFSTHTEFKLLNDAQTPPWQPPG
jgi:hypothetical protein